MDVRIESLLAGAKKSEGIVVIIDVYRAFTTAAVALFRGASRLVLTSELDEALLLRRQKVGDCCIGEIGGIKPEDFDFGNSPYDIGREDLTGRVPILSTRAGTVGINAAWHAEKLYGASLINAEATARAIVRQHPALVTLVPMGWEGRVRTDEDEICAIYIKNLIQGSPMDSGAVRTLVEGCHESRKFDDPAQPHFQPGDREWALSINRIPFAIRVTRRDRQLWAEKEDVEK